MPVAYKIGRTNHQIDLNNIALSLQSLCMVLNRTTNELLKLSQQPVASPYIEAKEVFVPLGRNQPVEGWFQALSGSQYYSVHFGCRGKKQLACRSKHFTIKSALQCNQAYREKQVKSQAAKVQSIKVKTCVQTKVQATVAKKVETTTSQQNVRNIAVQNSKTVTVEDTKKKLIDSSTANGAKQFDETLLLKQVEESANRNEYVSEHLPSLVAQGDIVLRVDNLPGTTSMAMLNSLLTTTWIYSSQVVAVIYPHRKSSRMNTRIVIRSDDPNVEKILGWNSYEMMDNLKVITSRVDFKQLEQFMSKNYDKIAQLSDDFNGH